MIDAPHRVSVFTKAAYGLGSVAYGVKSNGFDYFFLIFYSQVMGVDASLVGAALLLALVCDAFSDPLIGYFSDNLHTRWGRRHPLMYASALPIAVSYYFIWNPPAILQGNELFPYLFIMAVLVRTLITLYEVPSSALVAEMTSEYDERTSMLSYRYFFGWSGGTLMAAVTLTLFLVPTPDIPNGIFNIAGYSQMGLVGSVTMLVVILVSALGTHSFIPKLRQSPRPQRARGLRQIYGDIYETLASRSFVALFLAAIFGAVASGVSGGLSFYISTFYWGFSTSQVGFLAASVVISAMLGFFVTPWISRVFGKKHGAMMIGLLAFTLAPLPVALRLFDLMPDNGSSWLFPIVLVVAVIDVAFIISFQILSASMVADLVEEGELKTRRRSEGVFFSVITFTRKMTQGLGVVAATAILTVIEFPVGAMPGDVPAEAVFKLGAYYAPTVLVLWVLMLLCLSLYTIDRQQHQQNLEALGRV